MLPEALKQEIQQAYRQLQEARSLTPRYGQRLMIAEIAKALSAAPPVEQRSVEVEEADEAQVPTTADGTAVIASDASTRAAADEMGPVCVVEAGTGTGKTLAYVLGTLPLARHLGYRVVLATATVALQEQILYRDLPDIQRHTDLEFSYALAKGRGRYLCLSRLDVALQDNASQQAMEELFGDVLETPDVAGNRELYEKMLEAVSGGRWDGDRDGWDGIISDADWRPVTVEPGQCAGQRCSHYSNCCFYRARDEVRKVDCVVANHDLVLVDLALGGGVILPDPEKTLYIFDEAHHLPTKTNQHFACTTLLRGSLQWLSSCRKALVKMGSDPALAGQASARHDTAPAQRQLMTLEEEVGAVLPLFEQIAGQQADAADGGLRHTFELGRVPDEVRNLSEGLGQGFALLETQLSDASSELRRDMEEADDPAARQQAERWFPLIGGMATRAQGSRDLWRHFARQDPEGRAPWARWMTVIEQGQTGDPDIQLACSPVLAADTLRETLWRRCGGAVLTSATLSALGRFDVLAMRTGLPPHTVYHRIASPFNYQESARFVVPKVGCEPGDAR
ncbi:MAG: ATP-dependent DNA helicase DinG, partial [Pseudomonadota bacterium]